MREPKWDSKRAILASSGLTGALVKVLKKGTSTILAKDLERGRPTLPPRLSLWCLFNQFSTRDMSSWSGTAEVEMDRDWWETEAVRALTLDLAVTNTLLSASMMLPQFRAGVSSLRGTVICFLEGPLIVDLIVPLASGLELGVEPALGAKAASNMATMRSLGRSGNDFASSRSLTGSLPA
jgi:hypothetical protein